MYVNLVIIIILIQLCYYEYIFETDFYYCTIVCSTDYKAIKIYIYGS